MRQKYIDGLRGIAASAVMMDHFGGRIGEGLPSWLASTLNFGHLGVAIFFVISGYVIALSIGERTITANYFGRFALRRSIRLDPPYWVSMAVAIGLAMLAAKLGFAKQLPTASQILAHLFYLQDILDYPQIIAVYWTLSLEIQFYLFLVVLLWVNGPRFSAPFYAGALVLFVFSLAEHAGLSFSLRGSFVPYWFSFFLGAVTHWTLAGRSSWRYLFSLIALTIVIAPIAHGSFNIVVVITSISICIVNRETALSGTVLQFLGRISYSLYLYHAIVGWTTMSVALRILPPIPSMFVGIAASVFTAWIAHATVERASIRLSHRVRMPA